MAFDPIAAASGTGQETSAGGGSSSSSSSWISSAWEWAHHPIDNTINGVSNWWSREKAAFEEHLEKKATDKVEEVATKKLDEVKKNDIDPILSEVRSGVQSVKRALVGDDQQQPGSDQQAAGGQTQGQSGGGGILGWIKNKWNSLFGGSGNGTSFGDSGEEQSSGLWGMLESIPLLGYLFKALHIVVEIFSSFIGGAGSFISDMFGRGNDGSTGAKVAEEVKNVGHKIEQSSIVQGAENLGHKLANKARYTYAEIREHWGASNRDLAVMKQESGGKANAVSSAHAQGLMQIMPKTGQQLAAEAGVAYDPSDAHQNFVLGQRYLDQLSNRYHGDMEKTFAAYNAGPHAVDVAVKNHGDDWLNHMPAETRKYVPAVMSHMQNFAREEAASVMTASYHQPQIGDMASVQSPSSPTSTPRTGGGNTVILQPSA